MIKLIKIDGGNSFLGGAFICAICQKTILAKDGNVLFKEWGAEQEPTFVHRTCDKFEARGENPYWLPLDEFIVQLILNSELDYKPTIRRKSLMPR